MIIVHTIDEKMMMLLLGGDQQTTIIYKRGNKRASIEVARSHGGRVVLVFAVLCSFSSSTEAEWEQKAD